MSRIIRCEKCNQKVGEIRDASLRKGVIYYCQKCHLSIRSQIAAAKYLKGGGSGSDFISSIFGPEFGKKGAWK